MEYVVPILAGLACGVLGGVPYMAAFAAMRRRRDASLVPAALAVAASLAILGVSCAIGWALARERLLVFAVALVAAFLAAVCVSAALFVRKPRP